MFGSDHPCYTLSSNASTVGDAVVSTASERPVSLGLYTETVQVLL
jgi:hypothetical protein